MLKKIAAYIEKNKLLHAGDKILVALSGGADSVALLHILQSLEYQCVVVHCNFHLRGKESDRDEKFVKNLCEKLYISLKIKHFDTKEYAQKNGISIEMAARELRYAWFYEILTEENAQAIAVAHHADDNVETLILNILRGTGLKGLCAMSAKNDKIIRPLLCVTRTEIENYLQENALQFVRDSTNAETEFKRNKIRNEILPLLETINPAAKKTLHEEIENFAGTYRIFAEKIAEIHKEIITKEGETLKISIKKLLKTADIQTVLFEILNKYGFNASQIRQIAQSLEKQAGLQFFSEKFHLTKDREFLFLQKSKKVEEQNFQTYFIDENCKQIYVPIFLSFERKCFTKNIEISKEKNRVQLDFSKLRFPLTLRHWQTGDSFTPFGMHGRKKLSDFFSDQKIPRNEKNNIWLLLSNNEIVWVVGHRLDNRFCITENTHEILEIQTK